MFPHNSLAVAKQTYTNVTENFTENFTEKEITIIALIRTNRHVTTIKMFEELGVSKQTIKTLEKS